MLCTTTSSLLGGGRCHAIHISMIMASCCSYVCNYTLEVVLYYRQPRALIKWLGGWSGMSMITIASLGTNNTMRASLLRKWKAPWRFLIKQQPWPLRSFFKHIHVSLCVASQELGLCCCYNTILFDRYRLAMQHTCIIARPLKLMAQSSRDYGAVYGGDYVDTCSGM